MIFIDIFICFSVMQVNGTPIAATAASPTLYKDSWQQRRYTFLSKNSMFAGELKEEVVIENTTDAEQK